jgi:geranylgeranyl diphosphate synthase type II
MDNDDSRRGKPSCHRVFGEAIAILAGNALHNFAFELISEAKYPPETGNKLIQELAKNSGTRGVLGGQVLDINSNNAKVTPSVLQELYLRKTASLFITAGNMACILANAPRKETNIILNFCRNIGVLFQIVDDIIDDQSSNGRTRNKNITCSRIYSVDKAIQLAKYRARIAVNSLSYFKNKAHLLQQFPNFILSKASNEAI